MYLESVRYGYNKCYHDISNAKNTDMYTDF